MTLSLGRLLDAEVVSKVRTMILQFFHAFFFLIWNDKIVVPFAVWWCVLEVNITLSVC